MSRNNYRNKLHLTGNHTGRFTWQPVARLCMFVLLISAFMLSGCAKKLPVYTEEVHVHIPGMTGEKKIAFLSDLHIVTVSDEIAEDQADTVRARVGWSSYEGISAEKQWPGWVDTLNETGADYVLLGGDMVDVATASNIDILKKDLNRLKIPYMYIRADHDIDDSPYLSGNVTAEKRYDYQSSVCEMSDVFTEDFDDFMIVGWNNSTSRLTPAGMEKIREAAATGKPLILLTHAPIGPLEDASLAEESRKVYSDRALIWSPYSNFTTYFPNDTPEGAATAELLDMLYADDSPFVEVLSGHLHFSWDGYISEHVHEHVFSAAFNRYMGMITVSGD